MDFDSFGVLLLVGYQLILLQLCVSQTNVCSQYGDVRLVNGTGSYEGRVEICRSGVWKTVCDYDWDGNDARVVCAQLNYLPQDALALNRAVFGQGSGSTLEFIYCSGSEPRITDCPVADYSPDYRCNHAGVRCLSCNTHGAVRLRGRSSQYYGRVEICVNGVWGTVCDDSWDSTDAGVVCKQLGYSRFESSAYSGARHGCGRGPIHLDNVRCRGSEQRLIDCSNTNHTLGGDCTHSEDASVYCQTTLLCQEGDLRLVGGSIDRGRVEICVNEIWGTICATNNWGQPEATVACKQLGFSGNDASVQSTYGSGTGPVHYSNIACTGRESRLSGCQRHRSTGSCYGDKAGVHCRFDYLPSPMRLQVICEESNLCTLSWQQPPIYYARQGTLLNYFANCSTMDARRDDQATTNVTCSFTYTSLRLQPCLFYNCCVAAVNEAGRGNSACQTILTHEAGEDSQSLGGATTTVAIISTLLVVVIITAGICFTVQIIYKLTTRKKRCPVHNIHVYETVRDPKPTKPVENTLKERNIHTCTAMQNEHNYRDGSLTPSVPPRVYSLSSSLDNIDNLENLRLQDLSNQVLKDQNSQVRDNENTYQPLSPPQSKRNGSEYQSLTQFKQHQDIEAKL